MGEYKRNRNIILGIFAGFCIFSIAFAFIAPNSSITPFLIVLCLLFAYLTYIQLKAVKRSHSDKRNRRLSQQQKRRRELLEKDRGKVIQFPIRDVKDSTDYESKKR